MFLDDVSLEGLKANAVARSMSNWMKVADKAYTTATEEELLIMLKIEVSTKRREYIANRIHSRYCALRAKREKEELLKCLT